MTRAVRPSVPLPPLLPAERRCKAVFKHVLNRQFSMCPGGYWQDAIAPPLAESARRRGGGPLTLLNVGANKGYNVAEFLARYWSRYNSHENSAAEPSAGGGGRPNASDWYQTLASAPVRVKWACGICSACLASPPAARPAAAGVAVHAIELEKHNVQALRRTAHGALPRRAPSTRCSADPVHHRCGTGAAPRLWRVAHPRRRVPPRSEQLHGERRVPVRRRLEPRRRGTSLLDRPARRGRAAGVVERLGHHTRRLCGARRRVVRRAAQPATAAEDRSHTRPALSALPHAVHLLSVRALLTLLVHPMRTTTHRD